VIENEPQIMRMIRAVAKNPIRTAPLDQEVADLEDGQDPDAFEIGVGLLSMDTSCVCG
jgi:hypothetical protein